MELLNKKGMWASMVQFTKDFIYNGWIIKTVNPATITSLHRKILSGKESGQSTWLQSGVGEVRQARGQQCNPHFTTLLSGDIINTVVELTDSFFF